jgi:DNA-directed RNA polymerase specialized sigma subunit
LSKEKIVNFQEIPYVKLSSIQKKKALEVLGRGNILLKKWAIYFPPKKYRQFRNAVMEGDTNPKYDGKERIPTDKLREFQKDLPVIRLIRDGVFSEFDGRSVEQAILESFSAMAKQHAHRWSLENDPIGLTREDFLQEAYMQIIEAMYSWMPEHNVEISTYVWRSLRNRMSNVANQQGNMLCPLTNTDLELMSRFEQTKRSLPSYFTFDDIIAELGLSSEEGQYLNVLLTRVFAENQLGTHDGENGADHDGLKNTGNDYTWYRVDVNQVSESEIVLQTQHVSDTLDRAGLSMVERKLIEIAMNPYNGWQTEFAKNHINPKTQKPYSRMRITQILQDARAKVKRVMEQQKLQVA